GAFFGAWLLRFEVEVIPLTKSTPELGRYVDLLPIVVALSPIVFYFLGLYRPRSSHSRVEEAVAVLSAVLLAMILLSGILSLYRPALRPGSIEYFTYSRAFLAMFALIQVTLVVATR